MGKSQSKPQSETIEDMNKEAYRHIELLRNQGVIDKLTELVKANAHYQLYPILKSDTNMSPCEISYFMEVTLPALTSMPPIDEKASDALITNLTTEINNLPPDEKIILETHLRGKLQNSINIYRALIKHTDILISKIDGLPKTSGGRRKK